MNDYKEIYKLYEGYLGLSYDSGPNASYTYQQGDNSYRKGALPTAIPGSGNNLYAMGQNSQGITAPVGDEEEKHTPVIDKINELMKQAHEDEMMYAVHMLGTLKEYIKANS